MNIPKEKNLAAQLVITAHILVAAFLAIRIGYYLSVGSYLALWANAAGALVLAALYFWRYSYEQNRMQ